MVVRVQKFTKIIVFSCVLICACLISTACSGNANLTETEDNIKITASEKVTNETTESQKVQHNLIHLLQKLRNRRVLPNLKLLTKKKLNHRKIQAEVNHQNRMPLIQKIKSLLSLRIIPGML